MSDELMPCPFCGGEPEINKIGNDVDSALKSVTILCYKCGIEKSQTVVGQTGAVLAYLLASVRKEWNTRNGVEYKHTPEPEGEDNGGDVVERTDVKWYSNI